MILRQGGRRSLRPDLQSNLEGRRHKPDYAVLVYTVVLLVLGLIVMYAISPAVAVLAHENSDYYFTRHLIAFLIGLVVMAVVYRVKISNLKQMSYILGGMSIILSIIILAVHGMAFRWLKIGGFSFQPTEMMKFSLLLWLGFFLAHQKAKGKIRDFSSTLKIVLYVLAGLALVVVILQRDLGSMVVLASITGICLFVSGHPMRTLILVLVALVLLGVVAVASTPYRRDRFQTFINPERDCLNEGYHACQALITVGSGGVFGLGVGNSVQAYGYLPETPTDSIFAIIAEKFGFLGSVFVIGVIGALVLRMFHISARTTSWEARIIVIGAATWVGVQSSINVGAMLGLLPLKGITLPFISYGGSSLIFVMAMIGVVLRISCYTSVRKYDLNSGQEGRAREGDAIRRGNRRTYNTPFGGR